MVSATWDHALNIGVSRSSKLLCLPKAIVQIVYNINSMAFVDFSHLFGGHFGDANRHGMLFALTIDCNWLACCCLQNINRLSSLM